jgi:hypothetical protein
MKIKEIANNIDLHKTEDGLALMSNNTLLLQGFTDIGTLASKWLLFMPLNIF